MTTAPMVYSNEVIVNLLTRCDTLTMPGGTHSWREQSVLTQELLPLLAGAIRALQGELVVARRQLVEATSPGPRPMQHGGGC